jgi:hypothetical protein
MDGMGETYKAMLEDIGGVEVRTSTLMYTFDHCDCEYYYQQFVASKMLSNFRLDVELQW